MTERPSFSPSCPDRTLAPSPASGPFSERASDLAGTRELAAQRWQSGLWQAGQDVVSEEAELVIRYEDLVTGARGECSLWAWPCEPLPLGLGHVLLDIFAGEHSLHRKGQAVMEDEGLCRVTLHKAEAVRLPQAPAGLEAGAVVAALRALEAGARHWARTGCFHRAAVFDPRAGLVLAIAEDTGRHNCLDRLAGWSNLSQTPLTGMVLLTTARLSAGFCAKSLRAGFRVLVSRGAVTSAAVECARAQGAALAGFARAHEDRLTLYTDQDKRFARPAGQKD